jgi:hypothetical protein
MTTTETIFRSPYLSRPVLGPELMKDLVSDPTARWRRGALVPVGPTN